VSIKDLFDVAGEVTLAGSKVLDDRPPATRDAPVVARLRAAGAVLIGRTNMTEFAFSGVGINPHYGTPGNPHEEWTGAHNVRRCQTHSIRGLRRYDLRRPNRRPVGATGIGRLRCRERQARVRVPAHEQGLSQPLPPLAPATGNRFPAGRRGTATDRNGPGKGGTANLVIRIGRAALIAPESRPIK